MEEIKPLAPHLLVTYCNPNLFDFETTQEIEDLTDFIGQRRALDAIQFGIKIKHGGYNIYALGPNGIGKRSIVNSIIAKEAVKRNVPPDWCYVYNFENPRQPIALQLPAGLGTELSIDMKNLIEDLKTNLPAAFETELYRDRAREINREIEQKQQKLLSSLEEEAKSQEMRILRTSKGFVIAPVKDNKVLTSKQFNNLPEQERKAKEEIIEKLSQELTHIVQQIQRLNKKRYKNEKLLEREFATTEVDHFIDKLKKKYQDFAEILEYLSAVQLDIVHNVKLFLKGEEPALGTAGEVVTQPFEFIRYQINVLVDNSTTHGAPVIYEDNPTYCNLFGKIEYVSQIGALVTDFTLIRKGSLHSSNGGYLIIDVIKILREPLAWESLKRAIRSHKIKIELPTQGLNLTSTVGLEPARIPLNNKIILLGDRSFYYLLSSLDPDFNELFKVAADFEETITRDNLSTQLYAKYIATQARKEKVRPLHRNAVARMIDHCSRLAEDSEKLSTIMRSLIDLLRESDHWAEESGRDIITLLDVQKSIDQHIYRLDRLRQQLFEQMAREIIFIDTEGEKVAQINGLSVIEFGNFSFGHPSRITAVTRLGKGSLVDIEREIKLGGPLHSKGILTLAGYLKSHYAKKWPLVLSISIVFEQIYVQVDGDSASVAELCVILSSLANLPIKQNLAITGSINQLGKVQPIGGVNEKIEGFFDICKIKGLTGDQGVLIPATNIKHLMLRDEVIAAAENKQFHIYPIVTIDDAISLLTGMPAGERDAKDNFPENTVNFLVEKQLEYYATLSKEWKIGISL